MATQATLSNTYFQECHELSEGNIGIHPQTLINHFKPTINNKNPTITPQILKSRPNGSFISIHMSVGQ